MQVNVPEFVFLISDLVAEKRSTAIVANRLCTLGAVMRDDQRESPNLYVSHFNMDKNYGPSALGSTIKSIIGDEVAPPADEEFFKSKYL